MELLPAPERIYVPDENLLTATKYLGLDPEFA